MEKGNEELFALLRNVLRGYSLSPVIASALRFFLRNPYESLVIVNREGNLEFIDRGSEKFFGLPEGGAKGMPVKELIPDSDLPRVLDTGTAFIGRVFEVKGMRRIGSQYPLIKDGEIIGALGRLIFRSLEEVERINRNMNRLRREVKSLRESQKHQHFAPHTFKNILGISSAIKDAVETAQKIAAIDTDVLITGESGTGKELFAQSIHNFANSERPFVRVNCPAIPFELSESELFGYERGAFTGASTSGKPGKFELAHNGTIFFDEIGSLPLTIQAKLLNVLQEREVERLGSTGIKKVKFRLVAASNEALKKLVREHKFREDLYYRIAKAGICIPSLRSRKEDIPVYVNHFLHTISNSFGTKFERLSDEALSCFMNYEWPGNVRELINVLEQACLKQWDGEEIPLSSLPHELTGFSTPTLSSSLETALPSSKTYKMEIQQKERKLILQSLERTGGNKRRAALLLGISRSTLYKKVKDYDISA